MKRLVLIATLVVGIAHSLTAQTMGTRMSLVPSLRIGDPRDSNYTLTGVSTPALLPSGGIVVIDVGGRGSVRMYDRFGNVVRYIARPGQGPNEFGTWAALRLGTIGDLIWLADQQRNRLMLFDTLGTLRSVRAGTSGVGGANGTAVFTSMLLSDGTGLREPGNECGAVSDWTVRRVSLRRIDSTGKELNALAELRPLPCGERIATGRNSWVFHTLNGPFTDEPLWGWQPGGSTITVVDRDAVASANPATFRVRRLNADGSVIFDQRYPYTPIPLTAAAMDSAKAVSLGTSVADAARPAALAIDWHFPAHMPTVSNMLVGIDGSTWLQREAQAGSRRHVWTVLDPAGTLIGDVTTPANFAPNAVDGNLLWGVERDADDVPTIVRLRLIIVTRGTTVPTGGP